MTWQDRPGNQTLKLTEHDYLNQDSCGRRANETKWGCVTRKGGGGVNTCNVTKAKKSLQKLCRHLHFPEFKSFQQAGMMWCRKPPEAKRWHLTVKKTHFSVFRKSALLASYKESFCVIHVYTSVYLTFSSLTRGLSQTFPMLMPQLWLGSSRWAEEQQAKWLLPKLLPSWSHYDLHSGN